MTKTTRITGLCALLMLSVAVLLSACGPSMSNAQRLERASQSVDKGDYRDAEIRLKALLQNEGDNADAWLLLGRVSLARYSYADAAEQFRRARANGTPIADVGVPMATTQLAQSDYDKALDTLNDIDASDDTLRANVAALQGRAYLGLNQVDDARNAFDHALEMVPDYAAALLGKAEIARSTDDVADAKSLLERAQRSEPDYAPAWLASGRLAYGNNNCAQATPAFEKFLSLENAGPPTQQFEARSYLADCQLRAGELAKAKRNVAVLMKQGSRSAFANYLQSLVDIRERNYEQAAQHLQQVLSVSPNNVRSLTLLASIRLVQDDTKSAELYLNQALARESSNVAALRLLASLYLKRDETDRAIRMLENAYARNSDSESIRSLLAQAMASRKGDAGKSRRAGDNAQLVAGDSALRIDTAMAMTRAGNTAAALALLDGFSPSNADERLRATAVRIEIDLRNQQPDQAAATARQLVADAPEDSAPLQLLARTYAAIGRNREAGEALDRALKNEPDNTPLLLARASAHARESDYDQARQTLKRVLELEPSSLPAQLALAELAAAAGDQAGSLSWLEKAHASHPENAQLAVNLVQAYLGARKTAPALKLADKLASDEPESAAFNRVLGIAQLADGKNDEAISTLKHAAALAPDDPSYRLDLAQAQLSAQKRDSALQVLKRLRSEHPQFIPAVSALARLQIQMGNADAALRSIQDITVDDDNRASLRALKGQVAVAQDDFKSAAEAYLGAYQAQPSQRYAVALFNARRRAGMDNPEQALVDWLERMPQDIAVTLRLAQWYQADGRIKAAEDSYKGVLAVNENNAVALNNLALIRSGNGEDDALDYARRAHQAAPNSAAITDTLGWLLVDAGDIAEGLSLLKKAAADLPDQPDVQYHLAAGLAATDDADDRAQARQLLEGILEDDTDFGERDSAQALLDRLKSPADND